MDYSQTVTHIGLCAGYGGIELGLKRVIPNLRSVALCEIEAFAIANLVAKMEAGLMDPAPIWPDLRTFPWAAFRDRVDILTGGYPCQPFSSAGKRAGKEDPRHLWPWIADGVRLLRPRLCFFENVEGHISLGLSDVIEDLAGMGYRTTWGIFSASEVGAPHQRKRVFILANKLGTGLEGLLHDAATEGRQDEGRLVAGRGEHRGDAWPSRPGEQQYRWEPPRVVANSKCSERRQNYDGESEQSAQKANRVAAHGQAMGNTRRELDGAGRNRHWKDDAVPAGRQGTVDAGSSGAVADSHRIDWSAQAEGREHDRQAGPAGEELGDSQSGNGEGQQVHLRQGQGEHRGASGSECDRRRQTQSPLGGDTDGSAGGMDYAELCVSCDNRTDELRLLGNGVVPATAERAFRVLIKELP